MSSKSKGLSTSGGIPAAVGGEGSDSQGQSKPLEPARASDPGPGLILVATPIGNAADISARALAVLEDADVVACEDTRVTAKLFAVHGIKVPMLPYHEHNAASQRPKLIKRMKHGETVALVSDAGMPLVSDPGFKLVNACIEAGLAVTCVPGPSSVTTALALSGLPADRFFFQGFLPTKRGPRISVFEELATLPGSLVIMESAKRLAAMLADAAGVLGHRDAAVTRELTKRFEEVRRGPLDELAAHYAAAGPPKGEVTVVVGPRPEAERKLDAAELDAVLRAELSQGSVRDAAQRAAQASGWPKRDVYRRALALADNLARTAANTSTEPSRGEGGA